MNSATNVYFKYSGFILITVGTSRNGQFNQKIGKKAIDQVKNCD